MDFFYEIDVIRLFLILSPIFAINFILVIVAILSIAKKALPWGQKWVWLLVVLLVDLIGPIIYFTIGSNMLDEKVAQLQDAERYQ